MLDAFIGRSENYALFHGKALVEVFLKRIHFNNDLPDSLISQDNEIDSVEIFFWLFRAIKILNKDVSGWQTLWV